MYRLGRAVGGFITGFGVFAIVTLFLILLPTIAYRELPPEGMIDRLIILRVGLLFGIVGFFVGLFTDEKDNK